MCVCVCVHKRMCVSKGYYCDRENEYTDVNKAKQQ